MRHGYDDRGRFVQHRSSIPTRCSIPCIAGTVQDCNLYQTVRVGYGRPRHFRPLNQSIGTWNLANLRF